MPVHNGARDLPATLQSVACQQTDGIEILILDSSEDDSCAIIAADFADRLPLRYYQRRDVKPWPEKTNIGVGMARADHVAMLHQDDLWLPVHIATMRRAIDGMGEAVLHIAAALLVDDHGRRIGCWSPPLAPGIHASSTMVERLLVQNFIAIPTPLIRRSAWIAVGGMEADLWYTADWDLYLKLARHGPVSVGAHPTTAFRIHGRSLTMTGSRNADSLQEQLDIVLARHGDGALAATLRRARASVSINCALAGAAAGNATGLGRAVATLLRLGPIELLYYLRDSRLVERLLPRIRLRLAGML